MADYDHGRLNVPKLFDVGPGVQNPFRGVFTEGARQTAVDAAEAITENRKNNPQNISLGYDLEEKVANTGQWSDGAMAQDWKNYQPDAVEGEKGVPPKVNPLDNPGAALAASTEVRAYHGGGSGAVTPREVPSAKAISMDVQEEQGKQVMFDQNKIPAWHDSSAFGQGLISFGLNLLSGNDLATSFNQAGNHFQKAYGLEKRQIWAQDLAEQGYDAHEIQAWVATGDPKALSDLNQKRAQLQQLALGKQQLAKATRENDPEYIQQQLDKEVRAEEREEKRLALSEQSQLASQAAAAESNRLAREQFEYKKKQDLKKENQDDWKKPEARDVVLSALQSGSNLQLANQPLTTFGGGVAKATSESPLLSHLVDQGFGGGDAQENKKVLSERRNFVQGPLRMATGAAYGPSEIDDYTTALFPTGADFNKPDVMRRKKFMQDVVMGVAQGVATGYRSSRLDMTHLKKAADDVASGAARPIRSKSTGLVVGVAYSTGQVLEF